MTKYVYKTSFKRTLASVFDAACFVVIYPFLKTRFKKRPAEKIKNILVIRIDHIGDLLKTIPVFEYLKFSFPESKVTFITTSQGKELFQGHPHIDEIRVFDSVWFSQRKNTSFSGFWDLYGLIKEIDADVVFDLRGDVRHIMAMMLAEVDYKVSYGITGGRYLLDVCPDYEADAPEERKNCRLVEAFIARVCTTGCFKKEDLISGASLYLNHTGEEELRDKFKLQKDLKNIIVHPLAGTPSKMWEKNRWEEVIARILNDFGNTRVIIVGKEVTGDRGVIAVTFQGQDRIVNLMGSTTIKDLVGLCKMADLVISCDSGPAHLAYALKTPLILLASGTNKIERWFEKKSNVSVLRGNVTCYDCQQEVCPKKRHYCMEVIRVDMVIQEVRRLMGVN